MTARWHDGMKLERNSVLCKARLQWGTHFTQHFTAHINDRMNIRGLPQTFVWLLPVSVYLSMRGGFQGDNCCL